MSNTVRWGYSDGMRIRMLAQRMVARFAPEVCAFCDGGSGTILDERLGTLKVCRECSGTGLSSTSNQSLQAAVKRSTRRAHRRPRNVA